LASRRGREVVTGFSWNACRGPSSNFSLLSMNNLSVEGSNNLFPEFEIQVLGEEEIENRAWPLP
jgi:hypothetical protein